MSIFDIFKKNNKKQSKDKKINCPRCDVQMRQITRAHITIDVCPKCEGIWLDKGEIDDLVKLGKRSAKRENK